MAFLWLTTTTSTCREQQKTANFLQMKITRIVDQFGPQNGAMNPMNSMASKPGTDWASSDSESHGGSTTISGAAQSDTIVIKIDTKTDPSYTFSGPAPNALGMLHEANSSVIDESDDIKTKENSTINNTEQTTDDDLKTAENNNDTPKLPITTIHPMELHNKLLFADQKQYIDIRPAKEYAASRIIRFINIPIHSDEELVTERLFYCSEHFWSFDSYGVHYGHLPTFTLYVVSNQEMMDNGTDQEWYQYLGAMLLKIKMKDDAFQRQFAGFSRLNIDFDTFSESHSYLIRTDDALLDDSQFTLQYPNIVIEDRLYLGDCDDARDREFITRFKITHILNVTIMVENEFENDEELDIQYLKREVMDSAEANMAEQLDVCLEFIDNALNANNGNNQNRVMVHCFAGVSRSASVIIAWLMKTRDMEFDDALRFLKDKRAIVCPNYGFQSQLIAWKKNGFQAPQSESDEEDQARQQLQDVVFIRKCSF